MILKVLFKTIENCVEWLKELKEGIIDVIMYFLLSFVYFRISFLEDNEQDTEEDIFITSFSYEKDLFALR